MELYKYQGAGNDFIIADNRSGSFHPSTAEISALCDRHYGIGADGLMLLENVGDSAAAAGDGYDFRMVYYNSDGSGGMMCGNGGRCIVAFAADLGIAPADGRLYRFIADDGPHLAEIISDGASDGAVPESAPVSTPKSPKTVRLKMADVEKITNVDVKSYYLNTGTRHFVKFVNNLDAYNVVDEGRVIRHLPQFAPIGTNVNFVEADGDVLHVRTYEKGVENETYACGTGITASAIAALRYYSLDPDRRAEIGRTIRREGAADGGKTAGRVHIPVRAVRDDLAVDFIETRKGAQDVWLTGPAAFVFRILIP